jgi:hypothetical protein
VGAYVVVAVLMGQSLTLLAKTKMKTKIKKRKRGNEACQECQNKFKVALGKKAPKVQRDVSKVGDVSATLFGQLR